MIDNTFTDIWGEVWKWADIYLIKISVFHCPWQRIATLTVNINLEKNLPDIRIKGRFAIIFFTCIYFILYNIGFLLGICNTDMKYRFKLIQDIVWGKKINEFRKVTEILSEAFLVLLLTKFFSYFAKFNPQNKSCMKIEGILSNSYCSHIISYPKCPHFKLAGCLDSYLNRFLSFFGYTIKQILYYFPVRYYLKSDTGLVYDLQIRFTCFEGKLLTHTMSFPVCVVMSLFNKTMEIFGDCLQHKANKQILHC